MHHALSLRCALVLAAALGASTPLGAQTAPHLPAGAQPTVNPAVRPQAINKITGSQAGSVSLPGTRPPFDQSLLVSVDGVHWGHTATVNYTNTCSYGPPSSCGVTPPHIPISVSWNASVPAAQMVLTATNSYYWIDTTPVGTACWDVTKISYVQGDQSTSHSSFGGPSPNATQSYSCTYQISMRANQNGSVQTITTNPVTVNVNIVKAAP